MGIQLSEAEAATVRQRIKLCAVITERQLTAALEAELAGYTYTAQNRRDMASLTAMFATEVAEQHRELLTPLPAEEWVPCPSCFGDGDDSDCFQCDGRGVVLA